MPQRKGFRPGPLVIFLSICAALAISAATWEILSNWESYLRQSESSAGFVLAARIVALITGVVFLLFGLLRRLRSSSPSLRLGGPFPFRLSLYSLSLALALTSLVHATGGFDDSRFLIRSFFNSALLTAFCLWICLLFARSEKPSSIPSGILKTFDLLATNTLVAVFLLEIVLNVVTKYSPSPIFWDEGSILSTLSSYRGKPGELYFDFPYNSGGYYDDEFFPADDSSLVVALLADSFGPGVVPHDRNFTTVAERILQREPQGSSGRAGIHTFGVVGIGMPEYAYLLENEVLGYAPSLVVLAVFVGNDIAVNKPPKTGRYALQNWWCFRIPGRILLARHQMREQASLKEPGEPESKGNPRAAYLDNSRLEHPTLTNEVFLATELVRLEICNLQNRSLQERYRNFFKYLQFFQTQLQDKLVVVIIPDEFQVNNVLYAQLLREKRDPSHFHRDEPQRRIGEYCESSGIRYLDLLPMLRAAERQDRTYHRNDTHWNTHGNRVAGEALGHYLVNLLTP